MPMPSTAVPSSTKSLIILSTLLLPSNNDDAADASRDLFITDITREEFDDLAELASSNHVIVRGLEVFLRMMRDAQDATRAEWAETALEAERARVRNAMPHLHAICTAFEEEGHEVAVIKSLDHWPDLGSDLDLYTNASPDAVLELMKRRFHAETAARSWGDRLARKWNFMIPGLPEAVEIHVGRLGQTGEQVAIASALVRRSRLVDVDGRTFRVPAVSDRLMISTLQRMYRHFYFRLCDIIDSAGLVDAGAIDYADLRRSAEAAGIWEGVATYLVIVSDYVRHYRGSALDLPRFVIDAARFGGEEVFFRREFLRIPIMPNSASLYGSQLTGMLRKRELHNSARLGLLPWLATAALVGQKITGSDKGIW